MLAGVSLGLSVLAAVCWIVGLTHPSTLRWRIAHEHTVFAILEPWYLGFADQAGRRSNSSVACLCDTSTLGSELVSGSGLPAGGVMQTLPHMGLMHPIGFVHYTECPWTPRYVEMSSNKKVLFSASFRSTTLEIGWWIFIIAFLIPPGISWWRSRRLTTLHKTGACPTCGYDLRATPDRCPECGMVPEKMI